MKKTYNTPTTLLHHVKLQSMIAGSPTGLVFSADGETGSGSLIDEGATGAAAGRGFGSLWDDDE